jgi:hypothetical protein
MSAAFNSALPGLITAVAGAAASAAWARARTSTVGEAGMTALQARLAQAEAQLTAVQSENSELRRRLQQHEAAASTASSTPTSRPSDEAPCEVLPALKPAAARRALRGIRRPAARHHRRPLPQPTPSFSAPPRTADPAADAVAAVVPSPAEVVDLTLEESPIPAPEAPATTTTVAAAAAAAAAARDAANVGPPSGSTAEKNLAAAPGRPPAPPPSRAPPAPPIAPPAPSLPAPNPAASEKLRALPWAKLKLRSGGDGPSIWDTAANTAAAAATQAVIPALDNEALVQTFQLSASARRVQASAGRTRRSAGKTNAGGFKASKPRETKLLEPNRANGMCILLSTFKKQGVSDAQIAAALSDFDTGVLTLDDLDMLTQQCPTDEEFEAVRAHLAADDGLVTDGPDSLKLASMGRAEQFVASVLEVPSFRQRLRGMTYMGGFEARLGAVQRSIETLRAGCLAVHDSSSLPQVLRLALDAGNILNRGTFRGSAHAVDISFLDLLPTVRGATGSSTAAPRGANDHRSTTLLSMIVGHLDSHQPTLLDGLLRDLRPVGAAAAVDVNELRKVSKRSPCPTDKNASPTDQNAPRDRVGHVRSSPSWRMASSLSASTWRCHRTRSKRSIRR